MFLSSAWRSGSACPALGPCMSRARARPRDLVFNDRAPAFVTPTPTSHACAIRVLRPQHMHPTNDRAPASVSMCHGGRARQSPKSFFKFEHCQMFYFRKNYTTPIIPRSVVCGPSSCPVRCAHPFCLPEDPYMSDITTLDLFNKHIHG